MIKNITFGSDPEYFIKNEATGKIVSSIPIVNGTKEAPEPLGDGYFILQDNILVEGNIPPSNSMEMFIHHMHELKRRINAYIKAQYPVLSLHHDDCLDLDTVFLSHPSALQFGCSPYLNAWDKEIHRANDLSAESYRTAGFHIHIGYETDSIWNQETLNAIITKAFDLFVIIPSCLTHVDQRRFENYGGLGQYRDTSYGVECRGLGAFFVDDKYLPWVFRQTVRALEYMQNEENMYRLMYLAKPDARFKGGIFSFSSAIYPELGIDLNEQLIKIKTTINA
jgi:hypothetical protein